MNYEAEIPFREREKCDQIVMSSVSHAGKDQYSGKFFFAIFVRRISGKNTPNAYDTFRKGRDGHAYLWMFFKANNAR